MFHLEKLSRPTQNGTEMSRALKVAHICEPTVNIVFNFNQKTAVQLLVH